METWMGGGGAKSVMACMATKASARTEVRKGNAAARINGRTILFFLLCILLSATDGCEREGTRKDVPRREDGV